MVNQLPVKIQNIGSGVQQHQHIFDKLCPGPSTGQNYNEKDYVKLLPEIFILHFLKQTVENTVEIEKQNRLLSVLTIKWLTKFKKANQ